MSGLPFRFLGAFFAAKQQTRQACKKPGFPLQFLVPPAALLRDFHFNPLRGINFCQVLIAHSSLFIAHC
jgi:hypothetical protein